VLRPGLPAQEVLVIPPPVSEVESIEEIAPEVLTPRILYSVWPKQNSKVGIITFPSLDMSWPIFEGTDDEQLDRGVSHYSGSVLPGLQDNLVLAGHRNTVFNRLGELKVDDLINVKTSAGIFTYRVSNFRVVPRTDRTVIVPTSTAVLTLTTCHPFNKIGNTTDAFIVTAKLFRTYLN
jgi:sortase A